MYLFLLPSELDLQIEFKPQTYRNAIKICILYFKMFDEIVIVWMNFHDRLIVNN